MNTESAQLISVVIPAYNVELYVAECIQSLQRQTYSNFEVFLVNDGSTDQTQEVVESAILGDARFHLINQSNAGQSAARNRGLDKCSGEFIYFLDSDDRIDENFFAEAVEKMSCEHLDFITFNARSFMGEKWVDSGFSADTYLRQVPDSVDPVQYLLETEQFRCPVWLYFYRHQFLVDSKIRFTEGIVHEDESFNLIVNVTANKTAFVDRCYFQRRIRECSIMTGTKTFKNTKSYLQVFKDTASWYQVKNIEDSVVYSKAIKNRIAMFYVWALRGALKRGELAQFRRIALPNIVLIFKFVRLKNALAILTPKPLCKFLAS